MSRSIPTRLLAIILVLFPASTAFAQTSRAAWLRYGPIHDPRILQPYDRVVALDRSVIIDTAEAELSRGFQGMVGRSLAPAKRPTGGAIVLGTLDSLRKALPHLTSPKHLEADGFWLKTTSVKGHPAVIVAGSNDRGVLYGVFALLRHISLQQPIDVLDETENPSAPIRWTNEWDNLDSTIERGYGGRSIFFADGKVLPNLTLARDYARLLASVGINGCAINNVNADARVLTPEFLPQLARLAAAFRPWGIRLTVAVDFASPQKIGGLNTFDPADPRVAAWWQHKADEVYRQIPDLGGFLLKADSEDRPGPSTYHRTHAQAANMLARTLKPHGGVLIYRTFVYNHHLDYNDLKADRARAAYDNFAHLDGSFDDNVMLQIKYGPIDFQVREPVSPLIGALPHTNQVLELQITQEYLGQQRHVCFLPPMWDEILNFDLHDSDRDTPVKEIVAGHSFQRPLGGFVGVADVGQDGNWLGSDLAQANLFGFGRLAWNPNLSAKQIAEEWSQLTFGDDPLVTETVSQLLMDSWPAYEKYTGSPLGLQTLTNILGAHYGPGPESADGNGWGQWIRAGHDGVGMDRTFATGTGYARQYSPLVAQEYESLRTCPDNLLLFFHHVPYTYVLHSGETVIQTIYDSHYDGAAVAQSFPQRWKALRGYIDDGRYKAILAKLEYQAGHAMVWRDALDDWFFRLSGIPDEKGRVGHHPDRVEAESMHLQGYEIEKIQPEEAASNGEVVNCSSQSCAASFSFSGSTGTYDIAVQYFDLNSGQARFRLLVAGKPVSEWVADDTLPSKIPNADNSTRHTVTRVTLHPGDEIRIEGTPDGGDQAWFDYVEIKPAS